MATTETTKAKPAVTGRRAAARAALDVLLTDAAVERGGSRRFLRRGCRRRSTPASSRWVATSH